MLWFLRSDCYLYTFRCPKSPFPVDTSFPHILLAHSKSHSRLSCLLLLNFHTWSHQLGATQIIEALHAFLWYSKPWPRFVQNEPRNTIQLESYQRQLNWKLSYFGVGKFPPWTLIAVFVGFDPFLNQIYGANRSPDIVVVGLGFLFILRDRKLHYGWKIMTVVKDSIFETKIPGFTLLWSISQSSNSLRMFLLYAIIQAYSGLNSLPLSHLNFLLRRFRYIRFAWDFTDYLQESHVSIMPHYSHS